MLIKLLIDWLKNNKWNLAIRARLVAVVRWVHLQKHRPIAPMLVWGCRSGLHAPSLRADLHQGVRIGVQVEPPGWVAERPAIRGNQDEGAVNRKVKQWRSTHLARLPPPCAQQ